jgi:Spy/CpxP family protein refolding chaperone
MPRNRLHAAVLSATFTLLPAMGLLRPAHAADDDAPKPPAELPAGQRPAERPAGERPAADRPNGDRPAGERPGGRALNPAAMIDRVAEAAKGLSLSKEQLDKVTEASTKAKSALEELAKNAVGEGRERMAESMKILSQFRETVTSSLTDEQKEKLAQAAPFLNRLAGQRPGERPAQRPGARPGVERPAGDAPAPERPDSERPNVRRPNAERPDAERPRGERPAAGAERPGDAGARLTAATEAAKAALAKLDLTDEQKTKIAALNKDVEEKAKAVIAEAKEDRQALAQKLRPILDERRQKMAEILSPEQLAKFQEAMRQNQPQRPGVEGGRRPLNRERPAPEKPAEKPTEKTEG